MSASSKHGELRRSRRNGWMDDVPHDLYPRYIPSRWYLGTGGGCRWDGPGFSYTPCDWEADCVMGLGLRIRRSGPKPARLAPPPRDSGEPTALYRLHADDGALLYVGVSAEPLTRWKQHAGEKPWWPSVARFSLNWFRTRQEALAAETAAIRSEKPKHNVAHNGLVRK